MATQSLIMGEAFGKAFQFGKRKISAMSNEEFNELSMKQLASEMFASYKQITPDLKQAIEESTELQNHIIGKILEMPSQLIADTLATATGQSPSQKEEERLQQQESKLLEETASKNNFNTSTTVHSFVLKISKPLSRNPVSWTVKGTMEQLKQQLLSLATARNSIGQALNKMKSSSPNRKIQLQNYTFHQNKINALSKKIATLS
jgi:hypothetical protein